MASPRKSSQHYQESVGSLSLRVILPLLTKVGRQEEAKDVLELLLTQRPDFSVDFVRTTHLIADKAYLQHYLEGLKKSGVD